MKDIKATPCKVCKGTTYKFISKERFSNVVKCLDCGSEYLYSETSHELKLRKAVEKKMRSGELDTTFEKGKGSDRV